MAIKDSANTQTILGRSDSNYLTIIKASPVHARIPDDEALESPIPPSRGILRLPDELLLRIFTIATSHSNFGRERANNHPTCIALSTACHRFNYMISVILYRDLNIRMSCYKENSLLLRRATRCLHRTLKEKPSLRKNCRSLYIHIGCSPRNAVLMPYLMDLVAWLTSTKVLSMHGKFEVDNDKRSLFKTAVQHMPMLEEISFSRDLDLRQVYETVISLSHLKVLKLSGILILDGMLPRDTFKKGTSSITSLIITSFRDSSDVLRRLVAWSAKLEHFSFTGSIGPTSQITSLAIIASIIAPHKATLQSITISALRYKGLIGFDLTDFESLKYLWLSVWATGFEAGYEANLLAPRLNKFHWSFTVEDQHNEGLLDFGEIQEYWLRRFTTAAIARGLPLQEIYIQYAPDGYFLPEELPDIYPWDRMEHIARDIHAQKINLSWTLPTISREDFKDLFEPREETDDMDIIVTEGDEEEGREEDRPDSSEGSESGYKDFPVQSNTLTNYFDSVENSTRFR